MSQMINGNEKNQLTSSIVSLTQERLKEFLYYDQVTGNFTWRVNRRPNIKAGDKAGHLDESKGYIIITLFGFHYYAHVLAWFYMYGIWTEVDHKNRIGIDNSTINLRKASRSENNRNQGVRSDNILGTKGVTRTGSKFMARIFVDGKSIYLGSFDTIEQAITARTEAANKHFGEFSNG